MAEDDPLARRRITRLDLAGADLEALLAAIVLGSEDAIVAKDLDGIVRYWNPGAERLFGSRADEMVGRPVRVLIPEERQGEEDDILARLRRGGSVEARSEGPGRGSELVARLPRHEAEAFREAVRSVTLEQVDGIIRRAEGRRRKLDRSSSA